MFDIWFGDIELTTLVLIVSVIVILPLQVLLCFKARSLFVRLVPVIFLSWSAVMLVFIALNATGWDKAGYFLLALFLCIMLFACGIGWTVWFLISRIRNK